METILAPVNEGSPGKMAVKTETKKKRERRDRLQTDRQTDRQTDKQIERAAIALQDTPTIAQCGHEDRKKSIFQDFMQAGQSVVNIPGAHCIRAGQRAWATHIDNS